MNSTPGQGTAVAPPAVLGRLERYFKENERAIAAAFFAAGFVFDMLTVGRIDSWITIGQQAAYLAVIMAVLLQMFREQGQPAPETAAMPRLRRWVFEYRGAAVHFLLGALLNLYAIYFFKSSSLAVSFAFLGFLVVLLLANESRRFKALGLPFKFALLALCFLAFFATLLPVLAGSIGLAMFLASMLAGSVPLAAAGWWIRRTAPERFALARRQILVPLGCVVVGFLGFYLFRLIPPVPLSIPFIGVYHSVERNAEGYRLTHEREWWRFWHNGDQAFRAQPGDRIYVFFRIVSPARFADQVQVRWYWRAGGGIGGWALQDTIPMGIVGGREQGFRGYGFKSNYQPGSWKVQVETTDGREIGRIYFDLELAATSPRMWQSQVQ
ncbi:MAG TPA: DUF2914 domain-containing protein [Burkholderiales bacterium]